MAEQNRPLKEAKAFREKSMAGRLVALGTNFIAGIVVLGYAGHLLDKKLACYAQEEQARKNETKDRFKNYAIKIIKW